MTIPIPPSDMTVVAINSTGRQSASFIRVASAVGWHVRAQIRNREGLVAEELASLPNVELIEGDLTQPKATLIPFLNRLFEGAQLAFVNTTHWGDEVAIGKACADAAKNAGILHYVYSSMPDHSQYNPNWKALPLWYQKFTVENYIRDLGIPATFLITGIYNNNFTSLPYPVFQMELQDDGSFVWQAPFHPDDPLPWLDAEHDVGPALLQIFKMGPDAWKGQRVILAFERLTPLEVCKLFSRGVGRPVRYVRAPIKVEVSVPTGYKEHLQALQETLGDKRAPYFGPTYEYPNEALSLWEGYRGIEEYAREVFPLEEAANGLTWMEDSTSILSPVVENGNSIFDGVGANGARLLLNVKPPSLSMPSSTTSPGATGDSNHRHLDAMAASPKTPVGVSMARAHPEGEARDFFVGSC